MNKHHSTAAAIFLASVLLISGCGGGGSGGDGGTPATPAVTSFALQAGYKARISAGATDNFSISGTCTGSATISSSPAGVSTFEGIAGYSTTQTATITFSNCTPASQAITGTSYFDTNYTPLGGSTPGVEYTKFLTPPPALPVAVKVGDTAVFATLTTYSDSTKSTATGQRLLSYVVESDATSTAIVNYITKAYNISSQLLFTQQSRYRITTDGSLTVVSIDVQYSTTSSNHLLYTKI